MSLVQGIHDRLKDRILGGDLAGGTRLSANALAGELGVSRTPVRDAMNLLSAEGLLTLVPKSGFIVREFSYRELQEAFEMRIAIEPLAAELAAQRATYDVVRELGTRCRRMAALARRVCDAHFNATPLNEELWNADVGFHELILEAAGNRQMRKSVVDFRLLTCKLRYPSVRTVRAIANTLREHWHVYTAIRAKNAPRAAFWMRRHTECGMQRALRSYDELSGFDGKPVSAFAPPS